MNMNSEPEIDITEFKKMSLQNLQRKAQEYNVENVNFMGRYELIINILRKVAERNGVVFGSGTLEILPDGFGFLRNPDANYTSSSDDIYISPSQIRKFSLLTGDFVYGQMRPPRSGEKYPALAKILKINEKDANQNFCRINYDDLTPIYPAEKFNLEFDFENKDVSNRIIDIVAPMGKGQRSLIVAPPRTGKTMLMQNIAHAIIGNHPDVYLLVLLIDERPEEVTDMIRSVKRDNKNVEVVSSTFDEAAHRHVQLAEMTIAKAKRLVEGGKDVLILLDNITRLARAYNTVVPSSGKVLSGGVDSNALQRPKRFFGAARNTEESGSLSIIATALIETGSRMDEVIFEEFKGTGNSEIVLDRRISDKRIFPAIDINKSGTRKEDLLVEKSLLMKRWVLRRIISQMTSLESIEFIIEKIKNTKNNDHFFESMN